MREARLAAHGRLKVGASGTPTETKCSVLTLRKLPEGWGARARLRVFAGGGANTQSPPTRFAAGAQLKADTDHILDRRLVTVEICCVLTPNGMIHRRLIGLTPGTLAARSTMFQHSPA